MNELHPQLSARERKLLTRLELDVQNGLTEFARAGLALTEIHDRKLYRVYGTFEDYCHKRWMFTADYARKLITATEVLLDLGKSDTICIDDLPKHESQLRELAKAEPKQRALIWGESLADNDGKPPTAEQLRAKLEALRTIAPAAVAKAEKQMAEKIRKRCEQLARPEASKEEEAKKREQRDARANEHRQIFVRWKVSLGYSDKEIIDEVLDTLKHYRLVEKG